MNASVLSSRPTGATPADAPRAARVVIALLQRLRHGRLTLHLPDGRQLRLGHGEPAADVRVRDWRVFRDALREGDIGFADAYVRGDWETRDLRAVFDLLVANRADIERLVYGNPIARLWNRLRHALRRNTRAGARRNIHAHYDLGNAFYEHWLDRTMTYSSALFEGEPRRSLEAAQFAKLDRVLDALDCPAGADVLEIGCGWGGFIERASSRGLRVQGLTLSTEQHEFARSRLGDAIGEGRADVLLRDYRDETRRFDGIVSIEMFEAVGEAYWPSYFSTLSRCLKPGGRAVIQTITIDDALFERYRSGTDFIQQTIFPGGMLPSVARFEAEARRAGLRVLDRFAFGPDYAETLRRWHVRFARAWPRIQPLGFDERFARTWSLYLAYCEAAFRHGNTDVIQFTLAADR